MSTCKSCGKNLESKTSSGFWESLGGQLGFEASMIILGGYAAVCFYTLQSVVSIMASLVIGGVIFYCLLPKGHNKCSCCSNE
ncbi:hypothetical protein [Pseudoalteromonas aliena]|jgi:hypothetical protein|uniref:hypothetical protein n=1 Tax=Pseudoalteromonas aliena TaxID=247523 RepID=UPI0024954ED0|nr:hypothetical protein [Pseudoalteromonas aliena]